MNRRIIFQIVIVVLFVALLSSCTKDTTYSRSTTTPPPNNPPPAGSVLKDITYGSNVDWKGNMEQLKLDVYKPTGVDSGTKRPLIVWVHGGGFLVGDKEAGASFAILMADKGFVAAPINYRLGWTKNETDPCNSDTAQAFEAYYRALQDTRAAIRFLVEHADDYGIDTNWIFIGGASAGGITSLSIPYYTPENIQQYFGKAAVDKLGPLNTDNNLTNTFKIKGVLAMWGAIGSPDVITSQNAVPTIFFHGTDDSVVPFDVGPFYTCPNFQVGYGTKPLFDRLTSLGVPAVAHIEPGGGHGVYSEEFRADNSVCFLKSLMSKTPEKGYYIGEKYSCP